jgi:uncharacterized protein YvpB
MVAAGPMLFPIGLWVVMLFSALLSAFAAAAPSARAVLDVPVIAQAYNLSCEAASLQMALAYEGVSAGQASLLAAMKPDDSTPELRGGVVVRWSDPYVNFVGDPAGHEYDSTGYGVYYPVVARVAAAAGGSVAWSGTGLSWTELARHVRVGHPVVAWVAFDGTRYAAGRSLSSYVAWDGRRVPFGPGYEHAVTIAGVDDDSVLVNNPRWGYREWLPRAAFLAAFAVFGNMAVVLG